MTGIKWLVASALLAGTSVQAASEADATRWWGHVEALANDGMEGRFTGSPGYQRAADYVADQFAKAGLSPAGADGTFFQSVPLKEQTVDLAGSRVTLSGGKMKPRKLTTEDLLIGSRIQQLPSVDAPLVFIGYGMHMPEAGYDDFAGVDLKGKIAVYFSAGGPKALSGSLRSHARSNELYPALEKAGAVGAIGIADPKNMDVPWARQVLGASKPGMFLADPGQRDAKGALFTASFNPNNAAQLFAASGMTVEKLRAMADAGEKLPALDLKMSLKAEVKATLRDVTAPNVVGSLRGYSGLANTYVVLTAHLDGLGIGEPVNGDKIYNGAMDNASGVASLIEAARVLNMPANRSKRSILFVAVTGEERGLLGSRWFASHPTVKPASIVADVNMDMYLPIGPLTGVTIHGIDESTLSVPAKAAAAAHKLTIFPDPEPNRNLFVRSDQYSFIRNGYPAISLKFATPVGTQAMADQKAWLTARYHAPSDDLGQPVDKAAAAEFNGFLVDLIGRVADMPEAPAWNSNSFFRRFAKEKQ